MSWLGAQTTIQRWYLDPLVDDQGSIARCELYSRTITLAINSPASGSLRRSAGRTTRVDVDRQRRDTILTKTDGGPTSWQARIITRMPSDSYREFMLEFQDLQLAYRSTSIANPSDNPKQGWIDTANAINPPCYTAPPCAQPSLITTGVNALPAGTQSVNYTNEPIAMRLGPTSAFPRLVSGRAGRPAR
jgi:hypothetical protein